MIDDKEPIIHELLKAKGITLNSEYLRSKYKSLLSKLNEEQIEGVINSILCEQFYMILGTPGSGKTSAIVALLKILNHLEFKVLVVSHTNQAIDNLLLRLKQD